MSNPTLYGPDGTELHTGLNAGEIDALHKRGVRVTTESDASGAGGSGSGVSVDDDRDDDTDAAGDGTGDHESDPADHDPADPDGKTSDPLDNDNDTRPLGDDAFDQPELTGELDPENWVGAGDGDVEQPDALMEDRFEYLQQQIREDQSDTGERKHNRTDRLTDDEGNDTVSGNCSYESSRVREGMESAGIVRDLREEFREIKSRKRPVAARTGHGVDIRNAVRHASGDYGEKRVYQRRQQTETGDRCVGVTVDLSGSMNEYEAKQAVAALALATEEINDDFCAAGFTEARGHILTPLITAPDEDFDWRHLDSVGTRASTPTAAGIRDITALVEESSARQKCVIVVTDGRANVVDEDVATSMNAMEQARREVAAARAKNIPVIGLAVGGAKRYTTQLNEVFGADGYITGDMNGLHESLARAYKKFLRTT